MKRDSKRLFHYAALNSETAQKLLASWKIQNPTADSIVLWEDSGEKITWYSKAIFRICWLIGGIWAIPGFLSFLPTLALYPYSVLYRFFVRHRHKFTCFNPYECKLGLLRPDERFLP